MVIAGLLLAVEAWLGIGVIGGGIGIVCVIVFAALTVTDRQHKLQSLRIAAVYAALLAGTVLLLSWSARVAQRRATPVIAAVTRYRSEHGQYPASLDELVPAYLPAIPHAGFTRVSRHFHYYDGRPQLCFAGMFHGIFAYDFPTGTWTTNE